MSYYGATHTPANAVWAVGMRVVLCGIAILPPLGLQDGRCDGKLPVSEDEDEDEEGDCNFARGGPQSFAEGGYT